jgi:hypothetical protein
MTHGTAAKAVGRLSQRSIGASANRLRWISHQAK